MLCFPYISHDSTALCYTEGATQQNTNYRLPTEQRCGAFKNENIECCADIDIKVEMSEL